MNLSGTRQNLTPAVHLKQADHMTLVCLDSNPLRTEGESTGKKWKFKYNLFLFCRADTYTGLNPDNREIQDYLKI